MSGTVARSVGILLFTFSMGACLYILKMFSRSYSSSDGISPYAETQLSSFNPTQPYDISLHLVVPATSSNYDLGNFMTTLTLTGPSNKTLATVRMPVRQSSSRSYLRFPITLSTGNHPATLLFSLVKTHHYHAQSSTSIPLSIWCKSRHCQN